MGKRAVVSFANTPFYQEKMKRLQASVEAQGVEFIGYTSFEQVGCRPHSEIPYQFKPYAIQKAIEEGVTTLLWCDSPIIAIGDLNPVFEYIEKEGYMFFNNYGHPLGKWTNDKCLAYFGKTRQEAMNINQIMACCLGFKTYDELYGRFCVPFIDKWLSEYHSLSTNLYPGSWDNHRHDQTVMSFLIDKYKLNILEGHKTFFIYTHFRNVFQISPTVCLESK